MDDLISRQAAIEAINQICPIDTEYDCTLLDRVDVRCVLTELPSAQQEIIRCKDCKWYEIYQLKKDGTDDRRHRPSYCTNLSYKTCPDWYCADGERREDGE